MNTCASQHPADLTPLYESVHAIGVPRFDVKRVLLACSRSRSVPTRARVVVVVSLKLSFRATVILEFAFT